MLGISHIQQVSDDQQLPSTYPPIRQRSKGECGRPCATRRSLTRGGGSTLRCTRMKLM